MKTARILLILFAVLILTANAYASPLVSIPNTNTDAGAAIVIPINADLDLAIGGFQFAISYDSSVLNCTNASTTGTLAAGWYLDKNPQSGLYTVLGMDLSGIGTGPGVGVLVNLQCTAVGSAGASTSVAFNFSELGDLDANPVEHTATPGTFTINGSACTDNDSDTYSPDGGDCGPVDCNDSDPAVHPGATEVCNNVDDDCDFFVDEDLTRPTTCGVGACASTGTETCTSGAWGGDTCTPGTSGTETCNNIDDDCNGTTDDGLASTSTSCGVGVCARTGSLACVNGSMVDSCTPGAQTGTDNNCNDIDENCNGTTDENYLPTVTNCGIGACASTGQMICVLPNHALADNCVPTAPQTEGPFGSPTCSDLIDNDCDGTTDSADIDCVALRAVSIPPVSANAGAAVQIPVNIDDATGIGAFQFTVTYDPAVLDCIDASEGSLTAGWYLEKNPTPGQIIVLGLDLTETGLGSGSGSLVVLQCSAIGSYGSSTVLDITFSELVDVNANVIPGSAADGSFTVNTCTPTGPEVCDGNDNDCDGTADNGIAPVPTNCGVGVCARTGQSTCQGGAMVDNCTPGSTTGTDNNCNDIDENCNGTTDENYAPTATSCGIGACANTGQMVCVLPNHALADTCVPNAPQAEGPSGNVTCSDSIDNDCDGATDSADMNCVSPRGVSIPDMNSIPGVQVEIPININDATGIGAFQFTVTYNPAVLDCVDASEGTLTAGWYLEKNPTPGQIIVLGLDLTETGLGSGSGSLVVLQCSAIGVANETTPLDITFSELVDVNANVIPGAVTSGSVHIVGCIPSGAEVCDGVDNDCNGSTDEGIAPVMLRTTCGEGACKRPAYRECISGSLVDTCTAGDPVAETCNNLDDDCDGQVDDGVTRQTNCGIGGCARTGIETCTAGVWGGNTCSAGAPSQETCNSVDDDCDGAADEGVASVRTTCGQGACVARGTATCQGGVMVDSCTPRTAGTETCNRIDDDCDGQVDEDLTTVTSCGVGSCASTGQSTCTNGQMVNSCTPGAPSAEVCDGSDNDCDGSTDESIAAIRITCGTGICKRAGLRTCVSGSLTDNCTPGTPGIEGPTGATCSDNLDNDCDSAIDAADTNCQ